MIYVTPIYNTMMHVQLWSLLISNTPPAGIHQYLKILTVCVCLSVTDVGGSVYRVATSLEACGASRKVQSAILYRHLSRGARIMPALKCA